ncbi:MAG TPA: 50S ribosomal protein L10 [Bacteroidetes bacterium]|nr:50S ribosomal protein L10 [Bacteroidota bacterium]
MPRPEKVAVVESTVEAAEKASSIVLTDFTGLNVEQITELRAKLREQAIDYRVIKNTLAQISLEKVGHKELIDYLKGPTAFAFGYDDPGAPVRIILDFSKKIDKPKIKAVLFEGQLIPGDDAERLTSLPTRKELYAQFVGGLNAPIANFVYVLNGLLQKLVGTLDAIQRKKEEESN